MRDLGIADADSAHTQLGSCHPVTLVGGGPGDSELITVAGHKALMAADVVVADHLAPRDLIAELSPHVEVIDVSKHPRGRSAVQQQINELLIDRARKGKRVVRLKGGDGYVFGRGFEEVLALREAGIAVRSIPGLTSPVAVPALAGIPITHRGVVHEFTVVSGHLRPDHPSSLANWTALAQLRGTLVLLMAVENAGAIATALLEGGRETDTPVAVICDGSLSTQRTITSTLGRLGADVIAEGVRPPAVIVIGDVAAFAG
jgi:uroporphyrin-III C-methyltransferase/precorrin-2 dehydrogenase/sirohydrochlorin ferrochelatase